MKKIIIALGALVALFLAAIIVIPLVVDVDQYRPKLVQIVNDKIHGKLELGKLKLSLWGTIEVEVAGLSLTDAQNRKVISVKDAFVQIPWTSILGGSPLLTFRMDQPEVRVSKDVDGKMNVMKLLKETGETAASEAKAAETVKSGETTLPSFATNARIGIDLRNALLFYKDEATKSETQTKNLNFFVKDLSLSRETEMVLSGQIESAAEGVFKVSGPFKVTMVADPKVSGGKFQSLGVKLDANFDDIVVEAGGAFFKKKGITARIEGGLTSTPESIEISKITTKFFNAVIDTTGSIQNLKAPLEVGPTTDLKMTSNAIDLASWVELIPMLKEYSLSGSAKLDAFAQGPSAKLQYGADFSIQDLKAKSQYLKAEPVVNLNVKVVTDKIEKLLVTMKAPGNDVTIEGQLVSFTQPKIDLKIASQSLDLDQLIHLPAVDENGNAPDTTPKKPGIDSAKTDYDKLLDPLRSNEIAAATTMVMNTSVKLIKYYDIKMTDMNSKMSLKNLTAAIDSASITIFDGKFNMRASTAMKPKTPTYNFGMSIAGLDLQKAVTSKLQLFKNTLIGKMSLKLDGSGSSYNPDAATKNLNAKGSFKVENATFASIDIMKMVAEGANKALEKIPQAKGRTIKVVDKTSKYDSISTDFTLVNGTMSAPNFLAKASPNMGLDIKGSTEVGILNQELKANWELIDTYDMTKAKDVSVELVGRKVGLLSEGGKPVVLPIDIGCKYTNPCPSYNKLIDHFGKVALNNTKTQATQAVKEEAKEKAKDVGKKLLKGLFK